MGAAFSFLGSLLYCYFPKGQPSPPPNVVATPKSTDHSQRRASPTNLDRVEGSEVTCHLRPQSLLNPMNEHSQLLTTHDNPGVVVPEPLGPLRNLGRPSAVQLFALIIGIDDYINCNKLHGAVADAKSIKEYLEVVLRVSPDHISTLYDDNATRNAIIKAFERLQDDQRIRNGDPIVIFYAGHGGELDAPHSWGPQNKIQCLIPQDNGVSGTVPIPDRTVGALIEEIAKKKGDNITVIFDCCHSASGTRDHDEGYVPRSVDLNLKISATLDETIWGSRAGSVSGTFTYHGLRSHVLLAACGEKELAYEHEGHGQFTTALLKTLGNCAVNEFNYTELLKRIHLDKQNPHCEGYHQHRILFNAKVPVGGQVFHSAHIRDGDKYVIDAGLAHGVSHGVEFTLYSDSNRSLGALVVDSAAVIEDFETTVTTSVRLTDVSFAKMTRVGKLPLYLAPGGNLPSILEETPKFRFVGAKEAKLEVGMENDRVVFKVLDQRVKRFGLTKLPHNATLDSVARVLGSAAHYYWFLDLTREDDRIRAKHEMAVDFYVLQRDYDDYGLPLFSPEKPGLCRKDPNSDNADMIDFVVDPEALYGIEITNKTSWDLYLNAFLFNNSSLSIAPCYTQSTAGNPEAPLKQNGTFTIGYGAGGTPPFSYSLEDGQDVDVGYLKIFFATRPIDLSDIVQTSPFLDVGARDSTDDGARKARILPSLSPARPTESVHTWFTLDIPVVQRRG